jgi:aminoglycoside phosphotransferase (APT) family kinase protein
MLSPAGPVVIDWTNARRGEAALDVALTWVILATTGGVPGRIILRSFLPQFDEAEVRRALPAACAYRLDDPNVTERERRAVRRLLDPRDA